MANPKETRSIQTRNGVAHVPREQQGVPIKEYLQNTELPEDLDRAVIYATSSGPVAASPDPVPWTEVHDKKVEGFANRLKEQIDEHGYYKRSLERFGKNLSEETGYQREEMESLIASRFGEVYGSQPYDYLQNLRQAQGLPTRKQKQTQDQSPVQEM